MPGTVSLVGCGLMGSALARALKRDGHQVAGYDLDTTRVEALATDGIEAASSVTDAFLRSELVLISVPTYQIVEDLLASVDDAEAWRGRTVVNLVTGTPEEARACAATVGDKEGATYLEGAIFTYPGDIGRDHAMVVFSGPSTAWERHGEVLMRLGKASYYASDDIAVANVLDVAMAGAFYTVSLAALTQAVGYVRAEGVDVRASLAAAKREAEQLVADLDGAIEAIANDDHATDQAALDVGVKAVRTWYGAMHQAGQRASLMKATVETLERAQDAGLGKLGFFALVDTLDLGPDEK